MATAFWQVVAAYAFAVAGGWISTSLQLAHKQLCALISFATALIVALAIHSTTDGLVLGIQGETPAMDVTKLSLFSALCIHKVPEGLALGSLLIGAGLHRSAALGWVAAVEATTLFGGVIG